MSKHRTAPTQKVASGIVLGTMASGLAVTALWGAGTSGASCASISGVTAGSGSGGATCSSTGTSFAIATGQGATADAEGQFNGAIANGINATATAIGTNNYATAIGDSSPTPPPIALSVQVFPDPNDPNSHITGVISNGGTTAYANGANNRATATGINAWAVAAGTGNQATATGDNTGTNPLWSSNLPTAAFAQGINSSAVATGNRAYATASGMNVTAQALAPGAVAVAGIPAFTFRPQLMVTGPGLLNEGANNTAIATHPQGGAVAYTHSTNNTAINGVVGLNAPSGTTVINP